MALIVTLAGTFRHDGTVEDLAARLGAISSTGGMRYWSVTDQAWRVFVTAAVALTAPDGASRPDFSAAEIMSGAALYFAQKDSRSSRLVVYRLRVRIAASDRLVFMIENVSPIFWHGFRVYDPNSVRSAYFLDRLTDNTWTYYSFGTVAEGASTWFGNQASSVINRSVAFFRHLVGIPTDQEPPAAPR